jgi:hypothetical protein
MAEAGDGQDHQPRVQLMHGCRREAQAVHHPGAEVFDHHVGALQQAPQHFLPVGAFQVQADRFLVAVAGHEVGGLQVIRGANEGRAPASRIVPGSGVFHFDDPGAQVRQHHSGVRTGQGPAQVNNKVAGQGTPWVISSAHVLVPFLDQAWKVRWWSVRYSQPGTTSASQARTGPATITMPL